MAETLTPYINFKVAEGTDYFTYPNHVRYNFELADTAINAKLDKGIVSVDYNTAKKIEDKIIQSNPIGAVTAYVGIIAPTGWLLCNGSTFNALAYPALNTLLGGNILPDLRGEFIRGLDNGKGVDTGRTLLSGQTDDFKAHSHFVANGSSTTGGISSTNSLAKTKNAGSYHDYTLSGSATTPDRGKTNEVGGIETRPRNVAMNYIIKAL